MCVYLLKNSVCFFLKESKGVILRSYRELEANSLADAQRALAFNSLPKAITPSNSFNSSSNLSSN